MCTCIDIYAASGCGDISLHQILHSLRLLQLEMAAYRGEKYLKMFSNVGK